MMGCALSAWTITLKMTTHFATAMIVFFSEETTEHVENHLFVTF